MRSGDSGVEQQAEFGLRDPVTDVFRVRAADGDPVAGLVPPDPDVLAATDGTEDGLLAGADAEIARRVSASRDLSTHTTKKKRSSDSW